MIRFAAAAFSCIAILHVAWNCARAQGEIPSMQSLEVLSQDMETPNESPTEEESGGASGGQTGTGRTWTDNSGQFTVQASFISSDGENVRLQKVDGQIISVPLEHLSALDRQFVDAAQQAATIQVTGEEAAKMHGPGGAGAKEVTVDELKANGVFGFPQSTAKTLCDSSELRFSVWSNSKYLCAQSILWKDGDDSQGTMSDGRKVGDWSVLMLDLDADGQRTPRVDGQYCLDPYPNLRGLRYQTAVSARSWTGLQSNSQGRGSVQYVETYSLGRVRIDTYLIPLREIGRKVGDRIRLCYWVSSEKPKFTATSAEYAPAKPGFYSYQVPLDRYHEYVLAEGGDIDIRKIPAGRSR